MTRVAVVGARRRHQGTGFHLARFAAAAGAEVVAVVGTTDRTVEEAAEALARTGIHVGGRHTDLEDLVRTERLDALIVASPHEAHEAALEIALREGLHVLCEKPLLWGVIEPAVRALSLVERFRDASLHLVVQAQWPYTLETWRRLHPHVLDRPPTRFAMHLAPSRTGRRVLADALPHPLSLLAHVLPDAEARVLDPNVDRPAPGAVDVRFGYAARGHVVQSQVLLRHVPEPPRPAAYGFDGRMAERRVLPGEGYRMTLEGGGRVLPLPDPTPLLVMDFLERVSSSPDRAGPVEVDAAAWPGMRHLAEIDAAWPDRVDIDEEDPPHP